MNLADNGDYQTVLNSFLQDIHTGKVKPGQIHLGFYQNLASNLSGAVAEGLGGNTFNADDYRNTLKAFLDQNIYAFSAAKSDAMLREYHRFLTDENNELVSFSKFKEKVAGVSEKFNVQYLEAEHKNAVASAQMAEKWQSLQQFPALEYRTVGDDRVRPKHAALDGLILKTSDPLWSTIYPPNEWGCRCSVMPAATSDTPTEQATAIARTKAADIPAYFKKNVGVEKLVFSDGHPYIQNLGTKKLKELDAVKNYGMRSVEDIYEMDDLPDLNILPDKAAANNWWSNVAGGQRESFSLKSVDEITVTFDNQFRVHVLEENQDNRHQFIHRLIEVLKNPDEVWSNRVKGSIQSTYIKYYDGYPVLLGVKDDRAVTIYQAIKETTEVNFHAVENIRKGVLKYKK